ncbi:MAG: hypothetical protein ACHQ51_09115 [Elusimicrobiota bacterium]
MDIKDVLLQNENSIPTLDQNLSTAATTGTPLSLGHDTGSTLWKFGLSSILGLLGMYYLASGKKQNDVQKMLIGAGLTLASFFLF